MHEKVAGMITKHKFCPGTDTKCVCPIGEYCRNYPVKGEVRDTNQEFKADGGKLEPSLLFKGMPRALYAVIAVLQYGKQKYEAHSWKRVDGERYDDARLRHVLDHYLEDADKESGLEHMAHEATNCLFQLEKTLEALGDNWRDELKFKAPPTAHKEKISHAEDEKCAGCRSYEQCSGVCSERVRDEGGRDV